MTLGKRVLGGVLLSVLMTCFARADEPAAVFVGSSPCGDSIRPLLGIPKDSTAELMEWKLTLHTDANAQNPTRYTLRCEYGQIVANAKGVHHSKTIEREGRCAVGRDTKPARGATVYELDNAVALLKVSDDVLHVLNPDRSLMVGDAGWSYTLNRTNAAESPGDRDAAMAAPSMSHRMEPQASGPDVFAIFAGRSPCHGIARVLKSPKADEPGCIKAKWRVTLLQDPATRSPTTYKIEGSLYREQAREGKWSIARGTADDPTATVYRLEPAGMQAALNLLKGDDNVLFFLDAELKPLVGHAEFSYTLNRVTKKASTDGSK